MKTKEAIYQFKKNGKKTESEKKKKKRNGRKEKSRTKLGHGERHFKKIKQRPRQDRRGVPLERRNLIKHVRLDSFLILSRVCTLGVRVFLEKTLQLLLKKPE